LYKSEEHLIASRRILFFVQTITRDRRDACVQQLTPTKKPLDCIRVSVLGASGVGKTELIESLKCGLMQSLVRQGSALLSAVTGGGYRADRESATNGGGRSSASRTGWYMAPK
jgi:hypothetical protein